MMSFNCAPFYTKSTVIIIFRYRSYNILHVYYLNFGLLCLFPYFVDEFLLWQIEYFIKYIIFRHDLGY